MSRENEKVTIGSIMAALVIFFEKREKSNIVIALERNNFNLILILTS